MRCGLTLALIWLVGLLGLGACVCWLLVIGVVCCDVGCFGLFCFLFGFV